MLEAVLCSHPLPEAVACITGLGAPSTFNLELPRNSELSARSSLWKALEVPEIEVLVLQLPATCSEQHPSPGEDLLCLI